LDYAPRPKRYEQLTRAERLHDELNPAINYPFDYIAYRITAHRQQSEGTVLLVGEAVLPDLRLIVDALSRSLPLTENDRPIYTTTQLARRFDVSTRTIKRWRQMGLRWRWITPNEAGRAYIGFTEQAVEHFAKQHPQRVARAKTFSHMSETERRRIVERARRLAAVSESTPHQLAAHLARRTGRGTETIRLLLQQHDRDHPGTPIFSNHTAPLTPRQQRVIARAYHFGVRAGRIARRFQRSRATIYRVINERRAHEAHRHRLHYHVSSTFHRDDADQVLLRPGVVDEALSQSPGMSTVPVDDLPRPMQGLYRQPVIRDERQQSLLLRYNYLKFRAVRVREAFGRHNPRAGELDQFDDLLAQSQRVKALLLRANLPTVLSLARRQLLEQSDPGQRRLLQLLECGHRLLDEAIENYDPARQKAFSSYLSNTLIRRFAVDPAVAEGASSKAKRRLSDQERLYWLKEQARQAGVPLPEANQAPSPGTKQSSQEPQA